MDRDDIKATRQLIHRTVQKRPRSGQVIAVQGDSATVKMSGSGQIVTAKIQAGVITKPGDRAQLDRDPLQQSQLLVTNVSVAVAVPPAINGYGSSVIMHRWTEAPTDPGASMDIPILFAARKLIVTLALRTDRAAVTDDLRMQFSDDTTAANYNTLARAFLNTAASDVATQVLGTQAGIVLPRGATGASATAGRRSLIVAEIADYGSVEFSKEMTFHIACHPLNTSGNQFAVIGGGTWLDLTSPITNLTLFSTTSSNFVAGCAYMVEAVQ